MPTCALCEREVCRTTRHHLIPKQKGGKDGPIADLCQPCHKTLHHTFSNSHLARHYNTVEKLQKAEELATYLAWIRKRDIERLSFK
ncbi:MAG: HNH endonuclease [Microscillaceae bacterium]|nr:HNH endonuclease [Microscillaceae bacterium]